MSRLSPAPRGVIRQTRVLHLQQEGTGRPWTSCRELGLRFPEITSWIRATPQDFKLVADMGIPETGILVSCSDYHIFKKLHMTRTSGPGHLPGHREGGLQPPASCPPLPPGGHHPGGLLRLRGALRQRPPGPLRRQAGIPVKIRACDTLGAGRPLRRLHPAPVRAGHHLRPAPLRRRAQPGAWSGTATTTSTWPPPTPAHAWMYGASAVNCTLLGIGERTGQRPAGVHGVPVRRLPWALWTAWTPPPSPTSPGILPATTSATTFPSTAPFVGRNFNVTRAGIHADGLLKDEEIYNIFDTKTAAATAPPP